MRLACTVFVIAIILFHAPAQAVDTAALAQQGQRIMEVGRAMDSITRRCWALQGKTDSQTKDAGLINYLGYMSDIGGSWTAQVRVTTRFTNDATQLANDPAEAQKLLGIASMTLDNAGNFFKSASAVSTDQFGVDQNTEGNGILNEFKKLSADGLKVIDSLRSILGVFKMVPFNTSFMSRGISIQTRANQLGKRAEVVRKSATNGLEANMADEILLQSIYGYQHMLMATETSAYALLFPKQVKDQKKAAEVRDVMVKYVTHLQRSVDFFHNRLARYATTITNPELKRAMAELLEFNTSVQVFMVDLMSVVASGQDGPAASQQQAGSKPAPSAKPAQPGQAAKPAPNSGKINWENVY